METGQGDPLGLTARPAKSLECPFASPQVDDGSARRRVELLLPRLHAPNGEEPFARKSTRRKPPKCLWRSETFSTVQGLLDTAASGLPNAPSAFAEGSVNGCGSRPDVGLRTNDAGNLRTGVPCSGSAAVRSRVTAADSLGGPIWTGHSRSPPPLLRRRPPGWLGAPYGARASLPFGATLRGSPAGAGKGLRPFDPPLRPALGRRSRAAGSPVLVSWRRAKAAAAEVEHERTRQVARIGNNLNQIARWASWCSMKSGRKPSTSSRMVRAIARKPCGVIRSGGVSKARNVLSSQTCRLIIGDSGERVSMGQASGLPAGSLDRARTRSSASILLGDTGNSTDGRSGSESHEHVVYVERILVHPSAYYAT